MDQCNIEDERYLDFCFVHVVKSSPPIVVIHKRFLSYSSGTAGGIGNEVNDKLPAEKYSLAGMEGRGREREREEGVNSCSDF